MILHITHLHSQTKDILEGTSLTLADQLVKLYPHLEKAYPDLWAMVKLLRKGDFHVILEDDSHNEVDFNKSSVLLPEDLQKMAIRDIPGPKQPPIKATISKGDYNLYDYSHLLPDTYQKLGYKLAVQQNDNHPAWIRAQIIKNIPTDNETQTDSDNRIGILDGDLFGDYLNVDYAKVHPEHDRKGLGTAMYEALYHHAAKNGAKIVHGDLHSTLASKTHQKLSQKHGWEYKPVLSGRDIDPLDDPRPEAFDNRYSEYEYELKSESQDEVGDELLKMAIKDIPTGPQVAEPKLQGFFTGNTKYDWYDYGHLLTPEHQKKYRLYVRHAVDKHNKCHLIYSSLLKRQGTSNEVVGNIAADSNLKPPHYLSINFAEVEPKHHGHGFGRKMYEALYSHALNIMGINKVKGRLHSTLAYNAHQALAAKHGLKYEPKLNEATNKAHAFKPSAKGKFDNKYASYQYYLDKSESVVDDLLKAGEEDEVSRLLNNPDPVERKLALKLDSVTPSHLARVLTGTDHKLAHEALLHPKVDHSVLMALFGGPRPVGLQLAGLQHPLVDSNHLLGLYNTIKLYESPDDLPLKEALVKHPKLNPGLLETFYVEDILPKKPLLVHPNATEAMVNNPIADYLLDIQHQGKAGLAYLAMQSPKADPELLHQAVTRGDFNTKEWASKNPLLPAKTVSYLLTNGLVPKQDDSEVQARLNALDAFSVTPEHVGVAIKDVSPEVRSKAILHPEAGLEHLESVLDGSNASDILVALKSPCITPELLQKAMKHKDKSVAMVAKIKHQALEHNDFQKSLGDFLEEPLQKMAIKDIPAGRPSGYDSVDYTHLLPEEFQETGYKLFVAHHEGNAIMADKLLAQVWLPTKNPKQPYQPVGSVYGDILGKTLSLANANIRPAFPRNKGIGKAMYEALYHHAATQHGITRVLGNNHSTMAHYTHQSLANKHGWKYKAKPTKLEDRHDYGVPGYEGEPAYDDAYGPYSYALKSEGEVELAKMAIKDIPEGKHLPNYSDDESKQFYDYSHLLPDESKGAYKLFVRQTRNNPFNLGYLEAFLTHYGERSVGLLSGRLDQKDLYVSLADLEKEHRNKKLGNAMYEALYRHAMKLGAEKVIGGVHSSMASRAHNSISAKHGLDYKADVWSTYRPDGPYDERYGDYEYTLKTELGLAKTELVKMAIKDIPKGKPINMGSHWVIHDYTHLLPENTQKTHTLKTDPQKGLSENSVVLSLRKKPLEQDEFPEEEGYVEGGLDPQTNSFEVGLSKLAPHLRRQGIGQAMYEAAIRHAWDLGARAVSGGVHSTNAHRTHERLSQKHGWDYKAKARPRTSGSGIREIDEALASLGHNPSFEPGEFDGAYDEYHYALKAESEAEADLSKMAIRDISEGTKISPPRNSSIYTEWHDYSHILPPESSNEYRLIIGQENHGPNGNSLDPSLVSEVYHRPTGELVGAVSGILGSNKTLFTANAKIHESHHRKGLGKAAYEALYRHAMALGYDKVHGGFHSSMASRVHQSLSNKHGLDYKPVENHMFRKENRVEGPYDAKYDGYAYTLKTEDYIPLEEFWGLEKSVTPKDLKGISSGSDIAGGSALVDHSMHLDSHPPEHSHIVESYKANIVDSPKVVKRKGAKLSGSISRKAIYELSGLPLFGTPNAKFMVKPYHEKISRSFTNWMYHPHQGWAEMTNQALYHAGGIGHLHQKVFTVEHNFGEGNTHQPALVIHVEPDCQSNFWLHRDKPNINRQAIQIGLMDFLTNNLDRHGGNLLVTSKGNLLAIDHSRSFQYKKNYGNKWNKKSKPSWFDNNDNLRDYFTRRGILDNLANVPPDRDWDKQDLFREKFQEGVDWYASHADKIEATFQNHLKAIKDPKVRNHLWNNFQVRSNHLKQMSDFGVENFGRTFHVFTESHVEITQPGEE